MEYDDKNTFILFYETDKKTEKSPDYTGKYTDEHGKEWRMAAWERTSKNGKNFLSGKVDEFRSKEDGSSNKQSGGAWEQQRQKFAKKDEVVTDISDDPIDLSEIPF